jgi:hypothetical protein
MEYRIRYRDNGQACDTEALVDAHSPSEAVLKFKLTLGSRRWRQVPQVTSVRADVPEFEDQPSGWPEPS